MKNGSADALRTGKVTTMPSYIHETAPTQHVEANGIRFAYRRFGKTGGVPIVFNQHFQGTLDHWDPAVTDGLARTREVILFDNAGVAASSGETPSSFQKMGANAIAFVRALGLSKVDILGFSIGGMVSQEIVLQAPELVRKLILVGTGPRGSKASLRLSQAPPAESAPPSPSGSPRTAPRWPSLTRGAQTPRPPSSRRSKARGARPSRSRGVPRTRKPHGQRSRKRSA